MECGDTIKLEQEFVYRPKRIKVGGDNIIDLSPMCLRCLPKWRKRNRGI